MAGHRIPAREMEPVIDGIRWNESLAGDCIFQVTGMEMRLLRQAPSLESGPAPLNNMDASSHRQRREGKCPAGMVNEGGIHL